MTMPGGHVMVGSRLVTPTVACAETGPIPDAPTLTSLRMGEAPATEQSALAVMVTLAGSPGARVVKLALRAFPLPPHTPPGDVVQEMKFKDAGRLSDTITD